MAPLAAPRLWLVRHAAPQVAAGTCYGSLDVPADAAATRQAARRLAATLPATLAAARHSPLQRCEQLAQTLQALRPDLPLQPDARLAEMHFGAWEGRAWNTIARADIDAWTARFGDHGPGGGEPLRALLARVAAALEDARAQAAATGQDVLWITHAGVVRCVRWLQAHGDRLPLSHEWELPAPAFGEWTTVALGTGNERG